jgi:hypothetical protein
MTIEGFILLLLNESLKTVNTIWSLLIINLNGDL